MFKLEALKARHGDCLLLHWGTNVDQRLMLIDGGPDTTYREVLRPRLRELADKRGGMLDIDLVMLSHIDDDHINGLLDLADELESNKGGRVKPDGAMPVRIRGLWHNSLEGLLDDPLIEPATASVIASVGASLSVPPPSNAPEEAVEEYYQEKVLASVPQGQELHRYASGFGWPLNAQFKKLPLVHRDGRAKPINLHGLKISVIAPSKVELETLRKKWKQNRDESILTAYSDSSPYNKSSIVALVEYDNKQMLLTGDARGDVILKGLSELGLLDDNDHIHVDLLKLPHHGSQYNVTEDFFRQVTADHYVVSGDNVKFPNPAKEAMKWLAKARGNGKYKVYCTYKLPYMSKLFGDRLVTP